MRKCNHCGHSMNEGFCIFDGEEYYCSESCLHSKYSESEYNRLYESDKAYWTEWDDEEDVEAEL